MTDAEIRTAVLSAYAIKYPSWKNVAAPTIVPSATGGVMVVVLGDNEEDNEEIEEVCFVEKDGRVRIFDGTGDLLYYLSTVSASKLSFFSPPVIAGLAFLLTLGAVIALTLMRVENNSGMDALKGILALAAGFYFGNQASKT